MQFYQDMTTVVLHRIWKLYFFLLAIFWILEHCVLLGNWHYDFLSKRCSGELSAVICLTQELQKPKELFSTMKFFEMRNCFLVFFHEYKKLFESKISVLNTIQDMTSTFP